MTSCPESRATPARPRPTPAERARTVACRPVATVCAPGIDVRLALAAATTAEGRVLLVVPSAGPLAAAVDAAPGRDLSALLPVTDRAPVPLREPVRASLWLSGWATPVPAAQVRGELLA